MRKGTLYRDRKSLIVAIGDVPEPTDLTKRRVRAGSCQRINDIDRGEREQMCALASHVRNGPDEIGWQGLLHGQAPLRDLRVLTTPVFGARRDDAGRVCEERIDRIAQDGKRLAR